MKVIVEGRKFTDAKSLHKYVNENSQRILKDYQLIYFRPFAGGIAIGLIFFVIFGPHNFPVGFMYAVLGALIVFFIANANTLRLRTWAETYNDAKEDEREGLQKL